MPVDIKTLSAEIEAGCAEARTAIGTLQSELASAEGNVSDADAATIRMALSALKASHTPPNSSNPAEPPAPQPAPNPPTN